MSEIMDPKLARRLRDAHDEVESVAGLVVLGLRYFPDRKEWVAMLVSEDIADDPHIHPDDPSLYSAWDDDAPTALRLALAKAKKALGL